jgi:hypothetical protein
MAGPKVFLTISVVLSAFVLSAVAQGVILEGAIAQERGASPGIQDRAPAQPSPRYAGRVEATGSALAAPVGHRQPTLKGLPDSARDIARPAVDPLGPLPRICNAC